VDRPARTSASGVEDGAGRSGAKGRGPKRPGPKFAPDQARAETQRPARSSRTRDAGPDRPGSTFAADNARAETPRRAASGQPGRAARSPGPMETAGRGGTGPRSKRPPAKTAPDRARAATPRPEISRPGPPSRADQARAAQDQVAQDQASFGWANRDRGPVADAPAEPGADRVAKALARAGVASRRDVEKLIAEGRVALNGQVLTTPAVKVEAGDILTVDGQVVGEAEPARLFRYHKPVGQMTTHKDPQGRPTVFAGLPPGLPRLISVGRLDLNSEGLLLLTNDGGLARALELPGAGVMRRYRARAHGRVTQERLDALKDGVTVEGVRYGPIEARLDKAKEGGQGANLWITVSLAEGKNREVRRVLESLNLQVNRLIRLSYGPFALGTLEVGEIEEVGPRVIREQLADFIAPDALPKGDRTQFQRARTTAPIRRGRSAAAGSGDAPRPATRAGRPGRPAKDGETAPKMAYKAGWARPKPKSGPARPKDPAKSGPSRSGSSRPGSSRSGPPKRGR
jgi:23S rRNA pseudouridine2605 synthase